MSPPSAPVRFINGIGPSSPVRVIGNIPLDRVTADGIEFIPDPGDLININYLKFHLTPIEPVIHGEGCVCWNPQDHTIDIYSDVGDVRMQVGQEMWVRCRNNTANDIENGKAVYLTGAVGWRPAIAKARANSLATMTAVYVTTAEIKKNDDGYVCSFGIVRDVNTLGMVEGGLIYLSELVAGEWTQTPPASGYNLPFGVVLYAHPTKGMIFVRQAALPAFGNFLGGNCTVFEADGTMRAVGNATCYLDCLQSVTGAKLTSPSGDFEYDNAENAILAKITARYPTDYIATNWQLNHDWYNGSAIHPHIHWWQTTANTPNWLLAYRWQKQGQVKTTAWTNLPWTANQFVWAAGTLNQITEFGSIAAPVGYNQVSDIVQVRLYRDYTNVSGLFIGADPVNATQSIVNMDVHYQVDTLGSRSEYVK